MRGILGLELHADHRNQREERQGTPIREASLQITDEEHRARCQELLEHVNKEGLSGVVLFDPDYVRYYSGFAFVPTERPMA